MGLLLMDRASWAANFSSLPIRKNHDNRTPQKHLTSHDQEPPQFHAYCKCRSEHPVAPRAFRVAANMAWAAARLSASASAHPPSMPTPSWQYTIRNILSNLSQTVLSDSQLSDLHITLEDEDERSTPLSIETTSVTDAFFTTSTYHGDIKCLPRDFQTRPEMAKACSEWIASLFAGTAQQCQHSAFKWGVPLSVTTFSSWHSIMLLQLISNDRTWWLASVEIDREVPVN